MGGVPRPSTRWLYCHPNSVCSASEALGALSVSGSQEEERICLPYYTRYGKEWVTPPVLYFLRNLVEKFKSVMGGVWLRDPGTVDHAPRVMQVPCFLYLYMLTGYKDWCLGMR